MTTGLKSWRDALDRLAEGRPSVDVWTPYGNVALRWEHGRLRMGGRTGAQVLLRARIDRHGEQLPLWGCADA